MSEREKEPVIGPLELAERARIAREAWELGRKLRKGKRVTLPCSYWPPWVKR